MLASLATPVLTAVAAERPVFVLNEDNDHYFKKEAKEMTREALEACVNDSGCGGAKLNHVELPLSEHYDQIWNARSLGSWFCGNFEKYLSAEHTMPFDTHEWVALMAPRLVAIASASEDDWAGQFGEFLAARLASPAWELYGRKGLVGDRFPQPGEALQEGSVSYHLCLGPHNLTLADWTRYMDFADRHGWSAINKGTSK